MAEHAQNGFNNFRDVGGQWRYDTTRQVPAMQSEQQRRSHTSQLEPLRHHSAYLEHEVICQFCYAIMAAIAPHNSTAMVRSCLKVQVRQANSM